MKRPRGVDIISILIIIFASINLLNVLRGAISLMPKEGVGVVLMYPIQYHIISLAYMFVASALLIIFAANILRLKEWARSALLYLIIMILLANVANLIYTSVVRYIITSVRMLSWAIGVGLYGGVLYYFTRPRVKKAFE